MRSGDGNLAAERYGVKQGLFSVRKDKAESDSQSDKEDKRGACSTHLRVGGRRPQSVN